MNIKRENKFAVYSIFNGRHNLIGVYESVAAVELMLCRRYENNPETFVFIVENCATLEEVTKYAYNGTELIEII